MPEPNLPYINLDSLNMDDIKDSLPQMPDLSRDMLKNYNLRHQETEILVVCILSYRFLFIL